MRENLDMELYTPPQMVSAQEHDQIQVLLDGWADELVVRPLEIITSAGLSLPCRHRLMSFLILRTPSGLSG
jgi:hypothetical protein